MVPVADEVVKFPLVHLFRFQLTIWSIPSILLDLLKSTIHVTDEGMHGERNN